MNTYVLKCFYLLITYWKWFRINYGSKSMDVIIASITPPHTFMRGWEQGFCCSQQILKKNFTYTFWLHNMNFNKWKNVENQALIYENVNPLSFKEIYKFRIAHFLKHWLCVSVSLVIRNKCLKLKYEVFYQGAHQHGAMIPKRFRIKLLDFFQMLVEPGGSLSLWLH